MTSVAQPGNASACLTHTSSLGPWILDSGASDHLSGNKDLFSSITTTSDLPTITLANGSQTVAKGIGLALSLPSLPLTSVLYTPECPFNLISISKITRTLNCSDTMLREREREENLDSHSLYLLIIKKNIYTRLGVLTTIHVTYIKKERLYTINSLYSTILNPKFQLIIKLKIYSSFRMIQKSLKLIQLPICSFLVDSTPYSPHLVL